MDKFGPRELRGDCAITARPTRARGVGLESFVDNGYKRDPRNYYVSALPGARPVIAAERERYDPGDMLRANCSLPPSRPPVHLSFTLNNLPVSDANRHDCRVIESYGEWEIDW